MKYLIELNDILYICEHWLALEQECDIHKIIGENHQLIFKSSFTLSDKNFFNRRQGRPHGGVLWLIEKKLKIRDFVLLSDQISKIIIELNNNTSIAIYGVWLGFDDTQNRAGSFAAFQNNLLILESELSILNATETPFVFMGDFNADLNRKRRFDKHFNKFMVSNNLSACENLFATGELKYTYKKGRTTAYIDYALCRSDNNEFITAYNILNDPEDTSDHQPIRIEIEYDSTSLHVSESAPKNSKRNGVRSSRRLSISILNSKLNQIISLF